MADFLRQFRRATKELAIQRMIIATAGLPIDVQHSAVSSLVALVGGLPMLRLKVLRNMRLALGYDVPPRAESLYFRHLGWFLSRSLATFHYGLMATPVPEEVKFDASVHFLDDAVAEGRGAVLVSPHWSGHELVAAIINRRHPLVMLVRQATTAERMTRKLKWYNALGAEIVTQPNRISVVHDVRDYLTVLKRGKLLAITPDLLAEPGQGVETRIFGRPARLHRGAFTLSMLAKAPMIRVFGRWRPDSSVLVMFDRVPPNLAERDRDAATRAVVQDWCRWFEEKLRANPENWLFWLDKRWSRLLRVSPRSGAE